MIMDNKKGGKSLSHCPHCNITLTDWEQVLLTVDGELMCRNCWYRITIKTDENKNFPNLPTSREGEKTGDKES